MLPLLCMFWFVTITGASYRRWELNNGPRGRLQYNVHDSNNATQSHGTRLCLLYEAFMKPRKRFYKKDVVPIIAIEGSCMRIKCVSRFDTTTLVNLTWAHNSVRISSESPQISSRSDLLLKAVLREEAGVYSCEGYARTRNMLGQVELVVDSHEPPCHFQQLVMKRYRTQPPALSISARRGDCVRVHCAAFSENIVKVSWKDKMMNGETHTFPTGWLNLYNVSYWNTGYFHCTALLKGGKFLHRQIHLTIKSPVVEKKTCGSKRFRCSTGECMFLQYHCDRQIHCLDGSDEINCPDDCSGPRKFLCLNGRCIDRKRVCDRYHSNDCGDGSDENHCNNIIINHGPAQASTPPLLPSNHVPWLNTTVHCVIGVTVGIVVFTAAAVVFIYRHKLRQTRDIRRRIATVRRVRCAVQNDYQPPPARLTEMDPFLDDYGVSDGYPAPNIFLNVNSVHYLPHPPFLPSYSDVEDTRSTATPPPPYDNHTRSSSSSDYERLYGNPWRRRLAARRESHDYINVSQQVRPHDLCPAMTAARACQCAATRVQGSGGARRDSDSMPRHEYENCVNIRLPGEMRESDYTGEGTGGRRGAYDTCVSCAARRDTRVCGEGEAARGEGDVGEMNRILGEPEGSCVGMNGSNLGHCVHCRLCSVISDQPSLDLMSESNTSSDDSSDMSHVANCSCESPGLTTSLTDADLDRDSVRLSRVFGIEGVPCDTHPLRSSYENLKKVQYGSTHTSISTQTPANLTALGSRDAASLARKRLRGNAPVHDSSSDVHEVSLAPYTPCDSELTPLTRQNKEPPVNCTPTNTSRQRTRKSKTNKKRTKTRTDVEKKKALQSDEQHAKNNRVEDANHQQQAPYHCKACASFTGHKDKHPRIQSATYPITNVPKLRYSNGAHPRQPESLNTKPTKPTSADSSLRAAPPLTVYNLVTPKFSWTDTGNPGPALMNLHKSTTGSRPVKPTRVTPNSAQETHIMLGSALTNPKQPLVLPSLTETSQYHHQSSSPPNNHGHVLSSLMESNTELSSENMEPGPSTGQPLFHGASPSQSLPHCATSQPNPLTAGEKRTSPNDEDSDDACGGDAATCLYKETIV